MIYLTLKKYFPPCSNFNKRRRAGSCPGGVLLCHVVSRVTQSRVVTQPLWRQWSRCNESSKLAEESRAAVAAVVAAAAAEPPAKQSRLLRTAAVADGRTAGSTGGRRCSQVQG